MPAIVYQACALGRHTIFLCLKTGALQKNEPNQINVVHILLSM